MPYPIEKKLVLGVASSALFDLSESDRIFRTKGEEAYRRHQRKRQNDTLSMGVAFPFIRRILDLNTVFPDEQPVEVVLMSHNDPDTGLRVFNSIHECKLNISRAAFLSGSSPFKYIPAFNVSLFLSANPQDVKSAIDAGYAAGTVLKSQVNDDPEDRELRVAFDFDGVIADDEAEVVFQKNENVAEFHDTEKKKALIPHGPGPLKDLCTKLSRFQKLERKMEAKNEDYDRVLRIAIVSARNAPAHERMVTTLREWGIFADETFLLGGIDKQRVLRELKPHIFFDDQMTHLESAAGSIPSVHIPFGIRNVTP